MTKTKVASFLLLSGLCLSNAYCAEPAKEGYQGQPIKDEADYKKVEAYLVELGDAHYNKPPAWISPQVDQDNRTLQQVIDELQHLAESLRRKHTDQGNR